MSRDPSFVRFATFVGLVYCVLLAMVQTPAVRHRPTQPPTKQELQPAGEGEGSGPMEGFQKPRAEQRAFA